MVNISVSDPAKRKRGRPRKDANHSNSNRSPENHSPIKKQQIIKNPKECTVDSMVGRMIYGVIEGSFDAGFLVSIRIGSNATPYRGVVFEPEKFVPITSANDVAAQAKMYQRRELPIPVYDYQSSPQVVFRPGLPSMPLSSPSYVFNQGPKGSKHNSATSRDMVSESSYKATNGLIGEGSSDKLKGSSNVEMNFNFMEQIHQNEMIWSEIEQSRKNETQQTGVYYHEELKNPNLNFHQQDLFTDQSQPVESISKSPRLKLDLNELKSINHDFDQETNFELESRYVGIEERLNDESASYKLQLGTSQSAPSTGCISDLNFVLSNVADGHGNENDKLR